MNEVIPPYTMADKQFGYEQMNRDINIMHFLSVVFVGFVCLFHIGNNNIEETFRNR